VPGGFLWGVLPVRIAAQGENEGQRLAVGEKIRLLPHCAQQVERHHAARGDQPRQQLLRLFDGGRTRRGLPASQASFNERGGRRRQLRCPGQIKAQGMLCQPALRVIEGEKGALLLAPVRRPCCLELFCYQESLFRAWSWRPDRTRVGAISVNHPYRHIRGKGVQKLSEWL
jgi:hypothetical protein